MAVRVLIVDDSALIRQLLTELLGADPDILVVGIAADPFIAREKIKALRPDVITLDVEMPRMDGLTFLENLMRLHPLPVVMVSTLTERGAEVTLNALALGAVDFIAKPKLDVVAGLNEYAPLLIEKVKAAAQARVTHLSARTDTPRPLRPPLRALGFRTSDRLIAIGASAGGTEAIREVLMQMPADAPAVVIAQHIPAEFSAPFAARLDRSSQMSVSQAQDGALIVPGHAYVAPGGRHLTVIGDGARWRCRLSDTAPVNRHRPSIDVLFDSVAQCAAGNAIGAILTGMGSDGAQGLLQMRKAGAPTLAQDEASSVVWGMPGAAVRLGAAEEVLTLSRVAERLLTLAAQR